MLPRLASKLNALDDSSFEAMKAILEDDCHLFSKDSQTRIRNGKKTPGEIEAERAENIAPFMEQLELLDLDD